MVKDSAGSSEGKVTWLQRLRIFFVIELGDYPVYRVYYTNGQRTYPLHYAEAKGLWKVFGGFIKLDLEQCKKYL